MQEHPRESGFDTAALYIVPEREIDGFDHFEPCVALAQAGDDVIDAICHRLGVSPLSSFHSQDTDALNGHLRYEGYNPPDLPALTWFSAADGLRTVRALADHLDAHPETLTEQGEALRELRECEFVLARFDKEGIRWYMSVGF